MNVETRYCPQHGNIENPWGRCPVAYEEDPATYEEEPGDTHTCPWLVEEMDRRIKEVTDYGNYFELLPHEPGKPRMIQEYRDHEPYGYPRPIGEEK